MAERTNRDQAPKDVGDSKSPARGQKQEPPRQPKPGQDGHDERAPEPSD